MIYTDGRNACWIRVRAYTNHFRAATNNAQAYAQINDNLSFRDNRADAQADLDALANELRWNRVLDIGLHEVSQVSRFC